MGRPKKITAPQKDTALSTAFLPTLPDGLDKLPDGADRINNISQKEIALHAVGIDRKRAYQALKDALSAEVVSTVLVDGRMVENREPNHIIRTKAAVDILKAFGDMKEFEAKIGTQHNHVTYVWKASDRVTNVVQNG